MNRNLARSGGANTASAPRLGGGFVAGVRSFSSRAAAYGAVVGILASALSPAALGAQQGASPQTSPRALGELRQASRPERFAEYGGPKLGERYRLGGGAPDPLLGYVVTIVPGAGDASASPYRLAIGTDGAWQLVNSDNTLAARAEIAPNACEPKATVSVASKTLATIETRRGSMGDDEVPYPSGGAPAPVTFSIRQGGQTTFRSGPVRFERVGTKLLPQRFTVTAPKGERVTFDPSVDGSVAVHHVNAKMLDERVMVFLARFVQVLPTSLGLTNAVDRVVNQCR